MKKTLLSLFSLSLILVSTKVILSSSSGGRAFATNSGNTGAPSEATTCRNCHGSGFGTTVSISIKDTSGAAVTEYIAGDTLTVDVDVNTTSGSPSRYGFQIVTLDSNNGTYNNWTDPSANTRIASARNSRSYAEHRGKSTTSSFSTKWVAPSKGTGSITFYAGGAAVNNNGGTTGDGGNTTTLTLKEKSSTGLNQIENSAVVVLHPNPAQDILGLRFNSPIKPNSIVKIHDQSGKLLFDTVVSAGSNNTINIPVDQLSSGLYFISVSEDGNNFFESKFIKQ